MANSALEIYMRLRHHYSAAPGSSEREQNEAQKGFKDGYSEAIAQWQNATAVQVFHYYDFQAH